MESLLRTLPTFLCALFFFSSQANPAYNAEEIRSRLEAMPCIVAPRYTPVVESHIKGYLYRNKAAAERVLARAAVYFPVFEQYLREHNLPQDLKFLAIVESALLPKARSRVGAVGLWQFMGETGRNYGLHIDANVDERSCPHASTEAAMKYLAKQFARFGSWELALAAYNCGPNAIENAVKRAGGSKDYWRVARYLPQETARFVPAFLSAAYVVNFHHLHEVQPQLPNLDLQLTEATRVFVKLPFSTIAAVSGLPLEVVADLNPAFKKGFVPENPAGHFVMLPRRTMQAFKDYLELLRPDNGAASEMPKLPALVDTAEYSPDEFYYQSSYTVSEGDSLHSLGNLFSCAAYNLQAWNNLVSGIEVARGTELLVWFPKQFRRFPADRQQAVEAPQLFAAASPPLETSPAAVQLAAEKAAAEARLDEAKREEAAAAAMKAKRLAAPAFHQLRRNECLLDVAAKYPGATVQKLLEWNGFSKNNLPLPGARLKVTPPPPASPDMAAKP